MSDQFKRARQAGVPLIAYETSDPAASIKAFVKMMNGKTLSSAPIVEYDVIRGIVPVNERGAEALKDAEIESLPVGPSEALGELANKISKARDVSDKPTLFGCVVFFHMGNRFTDEPGPIQAIWNCRDIFKAQHAMLVILGPAVTLPPEIKQDVVVISEDLPDEAALADVCKTLLEEASMDAKLFEDKRAPVLDTLRGLSAFGAEQVAAMSLTKKGFDVQAMMKLKRSYISQLPGVEVREDKIAFADIAGYDNVKNLLIRKINGKRPPRLVIWWDEFDRTMAGNAGDTSGTSQDQMACLLLWLQDRLNEDRLSAMILVGIPGSGKSAIAASVRNEAQCECLRWDMGGLKDSLVGSSEKRIRSMLRVVDAMSGGHILLIATANNLKGVPSPVISRFALGTYFFPLPSREESAALWKLKRKKYEIPDSEPNPTEAPLTGREVQQCCYIANDLKITLAEALNYITPYYATNKAEIEDLTNQAHGRWLSASTPGIYTKPTQQAEVAPTGRRMSVE